MVIAGADDISVQEYADLGYQIIIYATTPAIVAANALMETYQHLKDTGLLNINAQRVADLRRRVEELISLPRITKKKRQQPRKAAALLLEKGGGPHRAARGGEPLESGATSPNVCCFSFWETREGGGRFLGKGGQIEM